MIHLGYPEIIATAFSLAMDAFSVSVCAGISHFGLGYARALVLGLAFGLFQFFMPLASSFIADYVSGVFNAWTPWIAATLIIWVAVKMIWETYKNGENCSSFDFSLHNIIILAFATSLDALAVGFSIESAGGSSFVLAAAAGIITFFLSAAGAIAGERLGARAGARSQYLGGIVLLVIAGRIIFSAL